MMGMWSRPKTRRIKSFLLEIIHSIYAKNKKEIYCMYGSRPLIEIYDVFSMPK
jgi:hypothetical protein